MFRFSISNAFRRKWVLVIAILGTGLGCALMTILMSIANGMDYRLNQTMNEFAGVPLEWGKGTTFGIVIHNLRVSQDADRLAYLRDGELFTEPTS